MYKQEEKTMKNKGVTLIALVITITILLVLAGISIAALSGENGLINKASSAKENTEVAQETEILQQAAVVAMGKSKTGDVEKELLDTELAKVSEITGTNQTSDGVEVTFNNGRTYLVDPDGNVTKITVMPTETDVAKLTTPVSENTKYKDSNNDIAVIPQGFKVSSVSTEQTIETGLVVIDGANNEWVWIPVNDVTEMYDEIPETALWGDTGVTSTKMSKSSIIADINRRCPRF